MRKGWFKKAATISLYRVVYMAVTEIVVSVMEKSDDNKIRKNIQKVRCSYIYAA